MPASAETWRCFVAVPTPPSLRESLAAAVDVWRSHPNVPDLRWTDPASWHVTLAFIGPVSPARVPPIVDELQAALLPLSAFVVPTGQVGAFPRPRAAMTAWYGVADPAGRLAALAAAVGEAVLPPGERPGLRPHLTVGRSRVRRGEPLGPWLATLTAPDGELPVSEVVLYRSHLGRGPARYESLAAVPLGGAESAGA